MTRLKCLEIQQNLLKWHSADTGLVLWIVGGDKVSFWHYLVDSLIPSMCFIQSYTDIFSARTGTKAKPKRNSKRSIKRGAAALPGLSHSWPEAISLGVESKTYRASLGIRRDAGGRVL